MKKLSEKNYAWFQMSYTFWNTLAGFSTTWDALVCWQLILEKLFTPGGAIAYQALGALLVAERPSWQQNVLFGLLLRLASLFFIYSECQHLLGTKTILMRSSKWHSHSSGCCHPATENWCSCGMLWRHEWVPVEWRSSRSWSTGCTKGFWGTCTLAPAAWSACMLSASGFKN